MNEDDSAADSVEEGESSGRCGSTVSPSADDLYAALARHPRRRVLSYLLQQPTATVDELADLLVGWEAAASDRAMGPDERTRVLLELVHVHLPHLDDADLVVYDAEADADAEATANEVRLRPIDEQVREAIGFALELDEAVESTGSG